MCNERSETTEVTSEWRVDQYSKVYDDEGVWYCDWDQLTDAEKEIVKQNPASAI